VGLSDEFSEVISLLVRVVDALGEYRGDIVVTGGLAPVLYRVHFQPVESDPEPLLTTDVDFVVPNDLPYRHNESLRSRFEANRLRIFVSRGVTPNRPNKQFVQKSEDNEKRVSPVHAELLTPLLGSRTERDGEPKSPMEVQDGLTAEALRYLDLILDSPLEFDVSEISNPKSSTPLPVKMARPGAFIIQKLLCSEERSRSENRIKDLAYCYDVALVTNGHWDEIECELSTLGRNSSDFRGYIQKAKKIAENSLLRPDAAGPSEIATIYEEPSIDKRRVSRVVGSFFRSIGLATN
jgi:hypothetical protein